jgi:hypothetical protein
MIKLEIYIPETHIDEVKTAMFAAGAGKIGNYDSCCWQTLGNGQFKPGENSNPYIGKKNEIEYVAEFKVELVCEDDCIEKVIKALKQSHPYETPAYQYWKVEN